MTTLPVPVRFELPDERWEPVAPESLGVENAAFLAVRRGASEDYAPTITVSGGWRNDDATLEQIADESVDSLRAQGATEVELVKRTRVESEHAPAVVQSLGALAQAEGRTFDLRQAQTIMGLVDVDDPGQRAVVILTLTCAFAQFAEIGREFQEFMASVEVAGVPLGAGRA
jgi:6,7-dimethyl-8-ribityllumazine synthase